MSIISVDFSKQYNEIEEFTIYHCSVSSFNNKSIEKISLCEDLIRIDILEYQDKTIGKKKVNEYRKEIVDNINVWSPYYINLFTSVDNNKIYFCIKLKKCISDTDLYTHISDKIKNVIKRY